MSLLAIITGILTLANYAFLTGQIYPVFVGTFLQAVLTIVTFMTAQPIADDASVVTTYTVVIKFLRCVLLSLWYLA